MPATHIKLYPLEAAVFYTDGGAQTRPCQSAEAAELWIELKLRQHGTAIAGHDIYPALVTNLNIYEGR